MKTSVEKNPTVVTAVLSKMLRGVSLTHFFRAGVKATPHISLNDTRRFDQRAAVRPHSQAPHIRFIIERFSTVWLAFSKFPVESSAGQAGILPPMWANMCLAAVDMGEDGPCVCWRVLCFTTLCVLAISAHLSSFRS